MSDQFNYLFSPLQIGPVTVKNRIYFGPHGTMLTDNENVPDERYVEYQRTRAIGGAGLLIAGSLNVMFNSRNMNKIMEGYNERTIPILAEIAKAAHNEGAKVFAQLMHSGRETDIELTRQATWAPSAVPSATYKTVPKEMEIEDIKELVRNFARSAGFVKDAGCDGIELHGASGYIFAQFCSPYTNKRTDEYGGSLENRLRFANEVIDAIRERIGDDMALGIRICGDDLVPGGNTIEDMKEVARLLEETGKVDFVHVGGPFYPGIFTVGMGMQVPLGLYTPYAAGFKEAVDLPVFNDMRINDPVFAEKVLADGQCDMVGMIRALIADPELPNKARAGKLEEIRYCIGDDQGCVGRVYGKSRTIACLQNAHAGREKELGPLEPARQKKKVLVAGGGPAGMEAARVARLRGHEVVLYERDKELGGQVNEAVKVPIRQEFGGITRYLTKQLEILGVKVNLGVEVTPELVAREAPDAVVIATGSVTTPLTVPGSNQENVVSAHDVLLGNAKVGDNVVVVDCGEGHWKSCSMAEYLIEQGKKVEIITPGLFVGMELINTMDLLPFYARVRTKGAVFSPNMALKEISGNTVVVIDIYANSVRKIEGVDTVVYVNYNKADDQLYRSLKGKVKELHRAGDCLAPRKALDAISDGYGVGRIL